jgi:hypothetical protein
MHSSAVDQRGYFLYRRDVFEQIQERLGPVAKSLMIELAARACHRDTAVRLRDGSMIHLRRGQALFAVNSWAKRIDRNPSSTYRALLRLEEEGYVSRGPNRRLKSGRGSAPTVVTITNYETFAGTPSANQETSETQSEKKELTKQSLVLQGRLGVGSNTSRTRQHIEVTSPPTWSGLESVEGQRIEPAPGTANLVLDGDAPERVLALYEASGGTPGDRTAALDAIAAILADGVPATDLTSSVRNYLRFEVESPMSATSYFNSSRWRDFIRF